MRTALVLALASWTLGCAGRLYERQHTYVPAPKATLLQAVQELIRSQGFELMQVDEATGLVHAQHHLDEVPVAMREQWFFFVADNHVAVERRFEARFSDDEPWRSADEVCDTYSYDLEQDQLTRIRLTLTDRRVARR